MLPNVLVLASSGATSGIDTVTTALTGQITSVGNSLLGIVPDMLGVVLPIVGAVLAATKGISLFKKFTNKA